MRYIVIDIMIEEKSKVDVECFSFFRKTTAVYPPFYGAVNGYAG